jgi:iron only hydrogenase large subunit-like protein
MKCIKVIDDNCVNCHQCVAQCPVKFCNNGSGDTVKLDPDLCIGCGKCIDACSHNARVAIDDFGQFIQLSDKNEPMVAIVAPAIAALYPKQYLNFNGWLKSMGVEAVFDVSFGAELTVKSYLEEIGESKQTTVIAQPCPVVVQYIETYQSELIPYLAKSHSPMMHTIAMIKHFYPKFADYKIIAISPCIAKSNEFEEQANEVLNVTMQSIEDYFLENGFNLSSFNEVPYTNSMAERATLFL